MTLTLAPFWALLFVGVLGLAAGFVAWLLLCIVGVSLIDRTDWAVLPLWGSWPVGVATTLLCWAWMAGAL